ncbi:hypothetical protein CXK91_06780 [Stutzerimonas stutzeri]|uniref:Uncharacterized protein n=1 Tax=Stutzerimonas stutzeri TaxID=316 RepID=A0A2S4ARZ5_STUST|nr:hypothetical protein [Stutzerimonas stutzeri]MCQ4264983.1 hypothetical protein [Stutzerimonas stutzeri]POH84251.1 hypothetical protein CXK91_06780 [Stutzerimonas stutzeri]
MNRIALLILLVFGMSAVGQAAPRIAKSPTDLVPAGYVVVEEVQGDLNNDDKTDYVLLIKGTNKEKFFDHEYLGTLDRNRRGIIVAFENNGEYQLALKNLDCFSSENEDGGVYFAPDLSISVHKGSLFISYGHGRYGYWSYNFRYQNSDFELIGYDSSQNRGPLIEREISINFLTKKILTRENINQDAKGGDERFKETWKRFTLPKPIKLEEITDFDELYIERLIES